MNERDLFLAFNDLDDIYLNTPQGMAIRKLRQRIIRKWLAVAACVMVLLSGTAYTVQKICYAINAPADIIYPDENTRATYADGHSDYMLSGAPITYSEIIQSAAVIVVADVLSDYDAMPESDFGAKRANIMVREVLKGAVNVGDTLIVCDNAWRTRSGEFGTSDGGLLLETGNRVLLFLNNIRTPAPDGSDQPRYAVGRYQKYFLDRDERFHLSASYGDHPICQYSLKTHIEYEPKTIEEYRELIGSTISTTVTSGEIVYPDRNKDPDFAQGPIT